MASSQALAIGAQVLVNLFLFFLVMGLASAVEISAMREQIRNWKAIVTSLCCQFLLLPFLGYLIVIIFKLAPPIGITLIIVVSSPGGSYSNWWCSLLNANLALSVAVTTASTFLSIGFLPLNLTLYTYSAYRNAEGSEKLLSSIDFAAVFIPIAVVIVAIAAGIFASWKFDSPRWHKISYIVGNVSGIALILFSTILSFVGGASGNNPAPHEFIEVDPVSVVQYLAIALPCILGLATATVAASLFRLPKAERLTTAVECCYQNTGIATSAALSLFSGQSEYLQQAMRVPFIYGLVEAVFIGLYLLIFWKLGWSLAPKDDPFCKVIVQSYQSNNSNEEQEKEGSEHNAAEENNSVAVEIGTVQAAESGSTN